MPSIKGYKELTKNTPL